MQGLSARGGGSSSRNTQGVLCVRARARAPLWCVWVDVCRAAEAEPRQRGVVIIMVMMMGVMMRVMAAQHKKVRKTP